LLAPLLLVASAAATGKPGVPSYDEDVATQYIWLNQVTGFPSEQIRNWTCGLACDTVKDVHNVRVTHQGLPLQTLGVVAQYGQDECVLAFRGSKTLLNYLLDDFYFVWTQPYNSTCPECRVHKGFYDSWLSLREQTFADLTALGCDKKPIRVTGHSLGAAIAVIASFELQEHYTLKHVYTFGQPRVANQAWVETFQRNMATIPYFRVVDYMDAVPHLPPKGFALIKDSPGIALSGYLHPGPEIFYNATRMGSYRACSGGEDPTCSDQYYLAECLLHTCCHCSYLGLNPCALNDAKPQCIQPKSIRISNESSRAQPLIV